MRESKFRFRNPVLESMEFIVNEDFNEEQYEGIRISGKTQIAKIRGKNEAGVKFHLKIGENHSTAPFSFDIIMKAEFQWEDSMEQEMVDRLLKSNARSLLLSYIRPIVANVTGNSEYPAFHIPYMNMSENEADFEEVDE